MAVDKITYEHNPYNSNTEGQETTILNWVSYRQRNVMNYSCVIPPLGRVRILWAIWGYPVWGLRILGGRVASHVSDNSVQLNKRDTICTHAKQLKLTKS